ncbi:MAG: hypothetical protein WC911_03270 [Thermoleophilia bacterium]
MQSGKKKLVGLVALFTLVGMLSGCGSDSGSSDTTSTTSVKTSSATAATGTSSASTGTTLKSSFGSITLDKVRFSNTKDPATGNPRSAIVIEVSCTGECKMSEADYDAFQNKTIPVKVTTAAGEELRRQAFSHTKSSNKMLFSYDVTGSHQGLKLYWPDNDPIEIDSLNPADKPS